MSRKIAYNTLNASTVDILNVIRQNASYDYQQEVPEITKASDIPKVGEVIYGTPAFANQFINALVNRIALVRVQSATFNNPYKALKKGYLEYGETVEDIYVNIANVVDYSAEKANTREFKRTPPDVRSAFHVMNWRVMYPVTIQDEDLRMAFLSADGVTDLIGRIVDTVYTAAEYDEFLLFKYLLIKAVAGGKMISYPTIIQQNDYTQAAVGFRSVSNMLPFMSSAFNNAGVKTTTPKDRQVIFMDATFNAQFDVSVLASAFNMDKADFMGKLYLIDSWATFDNERFEVIRANSDGLEEVTTEELTAMQNVYAVLCDERLFQIYDNNNKFTEKYVASGMYWNYFYHTWKTISTSPFANAVAFVNSNVTTEDPATLTVHIDSKDESDVASVLTFSVKSENETLTPSDLNFVQTEALTKAGIAVQKYGAVIIPNDKVGEGITLVAELAPASGLTPTQYTAAATIDGSTAVDSTVTLNKD